MKIGDKISSLRKQKGLNRDELGKIVGTSGAVIGRYERDEITPSVEIAKKMADALEVSLDYLTGSTGFVIQDKKMLYRLELLQKITQPERERILLVMDSLLRDAQINLTQQKLA
jgi:transcriptional regulator with XRE-family HTH domain